MKNIGRSLLTFIVVSILLILGTTASAQIKSASTNSNFPPNLKKYFTDKHKKIDWITSTLQQTPNGPLGSLDLMGSMMPKNAPSVGGSREDRSLAIAKAFLQEEAPLLGITNMDEIKEWGIPQTQKVAAGYDTAIYFKRYINNLQLDNWSIHIDIGPDETIDNVGASLVPAPQELYQAVTKSHLPEEKIREIVMKDWNSTKTTDQGNAHIREIRKLAIFKSPYVIWKVHAIPWKYTIDAFTGEILSKQSTIVED